LRLLEDFKANHGDIRVHCIAADTLYGTASFVDAASALFGGVQVLSQIRSNQNIRMGKQEQDVADYFSTHPGTPQRIYIRGVLMRSLAFPRNDEAISGKCYIEW